MGTATGVDAVAFANGDAEVGFWNAIAGVAWETVTVTVAVAWETVTVTVGDGVVSETAIGNVIPGVVWETAIGKRAALAANVTAT